MADQVDRIAIAGPHARANTALAKKLAVGDRLVPDLAATVGNLGSAQPALLLTAALEAAEPGQVIALVVLADGADVAAVPHHRRARAPGPRPAPWPSRWRRGAPIPYGTYLRWRGLLPVEPPRRPEPARPSASAAGRSEEWKFGFVGSADDDGEVHLPPQPADATDVPMSEATRHHRHLHRRPARLLAQPAGGVRGRRLRRGWAAARWSSPTSTSTQVHIGARVELTFRKLFTADGIHNYFWKARII